MWNNLSFGSLKSSKARPWLPKRPHTPSQDAEALLLADRTADLVVRPRHLLVPGNLHRDRHLLPVLLEVFKVVGVVRQHKDVSICLPHLAHCDLGLGVTLILLTEEFASTGEVLHVEFACFHHLLILYAVRLSSVFSA